MNTCGYCGKETTHKNYCCDAHRMYIWRKKDYQKKKEEHRCFVCGNKIEPIMIWRVRCPKHLVKKQGKNDKIV